MLNISIRSTKKCVNVEVGVVEQTQGIVFLNGMGCGRRIFKSVGMVENFVSPNNV
jgi:hypothetical protein